MIRTYAVASWLCVLGATTRVLACDAATRDADIARANQLRLRGRANEAVGVMQEVAARCSEGRVRVQLALAEQSAGRWYDAWRRLETVLAAHDDAWIEERRAVIESARDACLQHLVTLAPTSPVDGAELWVNGARVGALPLTRPHVAPPGNFTIEIRAAGHRTHRQDLALGEGESMRARITLESEYIAPAPTPLPLPLPVEPSPPVTESSSTPPLRYVGYGVVVLGVAAGAFGVYQWLRTASIRDSLNETAYDGEEPYASARVYFDRTSMTDACDRAAAEAPSDPLAARAAAVCDDHATARAMAFGFGIGGAVLAGVGVALVVTTRRPSRPVETRFSITPWLGSVQGAAASVQF